MANLSYINRGWSVGPGESKMGVSGPPGSDGTLNARALMTKTQQQQIGSVSLKTWEQITRTFLCPPLNDGSDLQLQADQLAFVVKEMDVQANTTVVLSLCKVNKLMQDQWDDFVLATTAGSAHVDDESVQFLRAMEIYGEATLEAYHNARVHIDTEEGKALEAKMTSENPGTDDGLMSLSEFYQRSTEPGFCYLTRHGILSRLAFAGVIVATNRAATLQEVDLTEFTDHYSQVVISVAKRTRCANVFGSAEKIAVGSKVWLELTRKLCGSSGKYGAFVIRPNGDRKQERAKLNDITYVDEAGAWRLGFCWVIGRVLEPSATNPQPFAMENANGTGHHISERIANEVFGSLPSMYVAIGYGH